MQTIPQLTTVDIVILILMLTHALRELILIMGFGLNLP